MLLVDKRRLSILPQLILITCSLLLCPVKLLSKEKFTLVYICVLVHHRLNEFVGEWLLKLINCQLKGYIFSGLTLNELNKWIFYLCWTKIWQALRLYWVPLKCISVKHIATSGPFVGVSWDLGTVECETPIRHLWWGYWYSCVETTKQWGYVPLEPACLEPAYNTGRYKFSFYIHTIGWLIFNTCLRNVSC